MATTTFSGPVVSNNGFASGTSTSPIAVTSAGNVSSSYATTSATTGDTRLSYQKLTFSSTGSGETLRSFSVVTGAGAAAGGTINGAHISMAVNTGGTISGAANALRATLGVAASVAPGGTIASIQCDSDIGSGATLPGNASFIRFTNSGSGTLSNLFNVPAAMVLNKTGTNSKVMKIVDDAGTAYYIMLATTVS